jgi:hypothetical protein
MEHLGASESAPNERFDCRIGNIVTRVRQLANLLPCRIAADDGGAPVRHTNNYPTTREHLWLWGHTAGSHNEEWNLPRSSQITPVEACAYLDIPNLLMVRYNGQPEMPYDQLTIPMRALSRVGWGITGARGETSHEEREHVLNLAARTPNITGLVMDDFINWDNGEPELSLDDLASLDERRKLPDRTLDLMTILYTHQLDSDLSDYLPYCNQISLWTWHATELDHLDANLTRLEAIAPSHQLFLGCYMWDLGPRAPMPLDRFVHQTEQGLEWLRSGRIAGMIFLASCYCDLELDTVEWLRQWIQQFGEEPIGG